MVSSGIAPGCSAPLSHGEELLPPQRPINAAGRAGEGASRGSGVPLAPRGGSPCAHLGMCGQASRPGDRSSSHPQMGVGVRLAGAALLHQLGLVLWSVSQQC